VHGTWFSDPDKITVVQVAPAVRAAWGEPLGIPSETATPGRMVAALKHLGFDYVFDTCFTADLTIMEEGTELLERLGVKESSHKPGPLPLFTSCCPGWVRFAKTQYPELEPQHIQHQVSAADVWCSSKNVLCRDTGRPRRQDRSNLNNAVYCQEV